MLSINIVNSNTTFVPAFEVSSQPNPLQPNPTLLKGGQDKMAELPHFPMLQPLLALGTSTS